MTELGTLSAVTSAVHPGTPVTLADRESFQMIAAIAHHEAGLVLSADKMPMVLARIAKRMRKLGMTDLSAYSRYVASQEGAQERREMIFTLTTNVTSFMREAHHFDFIRSNLISKFQRLLRKNDRVRIWSAGCSTGQEPYSIAMTLLDGIPDAAELDIKILATDIDPYVLEAARAGRYPASLTAPLGESWRKKYFTPTTAADPSDAELQVSDEIKSLVVFRELNLLGNWPMRGRFDLIFCRNVVIYFDSATQAKLWSRFSAILKDDGHICIGHSERIDPESMKGLRAIASTLYEKRSVSGFHEVEG